MGLSSGTSNQQRRDALWDKKSASAKNADGTL